ncbi:hypothetical protein niasHT_009598 [Heterodera trifolii]|uniref:Uncharacterized protein n=1 Tax=Heterodera trifolii TaxID=157864 RepID=A0ABD2M5A2_9BILA
MPLFFAIFSFLLLFILCHHCSFAAFLITNYPNPLNNASLWKCGISSPGPLCDPDSLLNETARNEALELFKQFQDQTDIDDNGDGSCKGKGVIVGLALTKQPIIARNARINVTDDLMKNIWQLDNRCNKALMLTLSVQPTPVVRFTRYMTTPVFDDELHHLIWTEMHWLRDRNYIMWVRLVLDGLRALIVDRHNTLGIGPAQQLAAANKKCASHGFVIFSAFIAVLCSIVGTMCAPLLWHKFCERFGPIVGKPSLPFPMVRFNNERDIGPYTTTNNGLQQQQQQQQQ